MSEVKHTPTPYEFSAFNWRDQADPYSFYIRGASSECESDEDCPEPTHERTCVSVAVVPGNPTGRETAEATAAFIVRACNFHAEMLDLCERALGFVRVSRTGSGNLEGALIALLAKIKDARP